jgi:beta-lactamase class A
MPRPRAAVVAFSCLALAAGCSGTIAGSRGHGGADGAPGNDDAASGAADAGIDPQVLEAELQATVDRLQAEASWRTPGSEVALAVRHLASGARASSRGGELYVSASSAKAWWVAAALDGAGVAAVEPYADPVFIDSDNGATGDVIDLVGPDAINVYIWDVVGMGRDTTALTQWNYEVTREAANSPRHMGSDNYTTADDAVIFLAGLQAGAVLDSTATAALSDWMTRSPRSGTGGWLAARLPADAQASARHKGGWLPPGCCSSDTYYNTLNEVGLVDTPRGTYAVAILTHAGDDWYGRQAPYVELASCEIYKTVSAAADIDCARDVDPPAP